MQTFMDLGGAECWAPGASVLAAVTALLLSRSAPAASNANCDRHLARHVLHPCQTASAFSVLDKVRRRSPAVKVTHPAASGPASWWCWHPSAAARIPLMRNLARFAVRAIANRSQ